MRVRACVCVCDTANDNIDLNRFAIKRPSDFSGSQFWVRMPCSGRDHVYFFGRNFPLVYRLGERTA